MTRYTTMTDEAVMVLAVDRRGCRRVWCVRILFLAIHRIEDTDALTLALYKGEGKDHMGKDCPLPCRFLSVVVLTD